MFLSNICMVFLYLLLKICIYHPVFRYDIELFLSPLLRCFIFSNWQLKQAYLFITTIWRTTSKCTFACFVFNAGCFFFVFFSLCRSRSLGTTINLIQKDNQLTHVTHDGFGTISLSYDYSDISLLPVMI